MYDIFIGGVDSADWRNEFKSRISADVSIIESVRRNSIETDFVEKIAEDINRIRNSLVSVFYICDCVSQEDLIKIAIELSESINKNKQIILCNESHPTWIDYYCEYHGACIVYSLEDMIMASEECLAQIELCSTNEDS